MEESSRQVQTINRTIACLTPFFLANNRISELGNINYDVEGNQLRSADTIHKTYSYNAAGQMSSTYYEHYVNSVRQYENFETISYSGDGQVVKIATVHDPVEGDNETDSSYQIRSTVLGGQTITKTDSTGAKLESAIVAAGSTVAKAFSDNSAIWTHYDPNSDSVRSTNSSGTVVDYDNDFGKLELDGSGRNVGLTNPYSGDPQWDNIPDLYQAQQSVGQMINGMPVTRKFNGLNVPEKYFQDMTEFSFFNLFGLQAQMAATIYKKLELPDPKIHAPGHVVPRIPQGAEAFADFTVGGEPVRQYYQAVDVASWSAYYLVLPKFRQYFELGDSPNSPPRLKQLKLKDLVNAKSFLKSVLDSGDCRSKLKELISKFEEISGVKAVSYDLSELFESITKQSKGGVFLNISPEHNLNAVLAVKLMNDFRLITTADFSTDPYGLAYRVGNARTIGKRYYDFNNEAFILMTSYGFDPSESDGHVAATQTANLLIHELLHVAAGSGTYDHDTVLFQNAVKEMGYESVNRFIQTHCPVSRK